MDGSHHAIRADVMTTTLCEQWVAELYPIAYPPSQQPTHMCCYAPYMQPQQPCPDRHRAQSPLPRVLLRAVPGGGNKRGDAETWFLTDRHLAQSTCSCVACRCCCVFMCRHVVMIRRLRRAACFLTDRHLA